MQARERPDRWWYHRLLGHAHATARVRAGRQARTVFGWMVERPDAPWLWAVNRAQVAPGAGGLGPQEVAALVETEHEARGLVHRAVDVRSAADAERLAPALRRSGYVVHDLGVLAARPSVLRDRAASEAGRVDVAAEAPEAAVDLRRSGLENELPWAGDEERDRVAAQWSTVPGCDVVHLLARSPDAAREPLGAAVLHLAATHVEVDDVVVHPEARSRGVGTALLAAAAARAAERGAGRVGLRADRSSRPYRWYRRLGLDDLGPAPEATRAQGGR